MQREEGGLEAVRVRGKITHLRSMGNKLVFIDLQQCINDTNDDSEMTTASAEAVKVMLDAATPELAQHGLPWFKATVGLLSPGAYASVVGYYGLNRRGQRIVIATTCTVERLQAHSSAVLKAVDYVISGVLDEATVLFSFGGTLAGMDELGELVALRKATPPPKQAKPRQPEPRAKSGATFTQLCSQLARGLAGAPAQRQR